MPAGDNYLALRFADRSLKILQGDFTYNGASTPEVDARIELIESPHPAEAAWFDRDGKMVWHSWP